MLQGLGKRQEKINTVMDEDDLRNWRNTFQGKPPPMAPSHPYYSRSAHRVDAMRQAEATSLEDEAFTQEPLRVEDVPLTESLADCRDRVGQFWEQELKHAIFSGSNVLVVGHKNCLRSLISHIQGNIDDDSLLSLGLPNALPIVYEFESNGKIRITEDHCVVPPMTGRYLGGECMEFNALDLDGDGRLNRHEMAKSDNYLDSGTLLEEADSNRDGFVDFNEYMAWRGKRATNSVIPDDVSIITPDMALDADGRVKQKGGVKQKGQNDADDRVGKDLLEKEEDAKHGGHVDADEHMIWPDRYKDPSKRLVADDNGFITKVSAFDSDEHEKQAKLRSANVDTSPEEDATRDGYVGLDQYLPLAENTKSLERT
jgi:broad specificity phosphatase PhoE